MRSTTVRRAVRIATAGTVALAASAVMLAPVNSDAINSLKINSLKINSLKINSL